MAYGGIMVVYIDSAVAHIVGEITKINQQRSKCQPYHVIQHKEHFLP